MPVTDENLTAEKLEDLVELLNRPPIEIELGKIFVHKGVGNALLYERDIISPDGILLTEADINSSNFFSDAPVLFHNNKVGVIDNAAHTATKGDITLMIKFDENLDDYKYIEENYDKLLVQPHIICNKIGCVICGNNYEIGQSPCECIYLAEYINTSFISITGLTLVDSTKEDINKINNKRELLRKFFGGAMAELIITEPI
jgi:hypothetical protein